MKLIGNLLLAVVFFCSCRPSDPQAKLLIGNWQSTGTRLTSTGDWTPISQGQTVAFLPGGLVRTTNTLFLSGGWCNAAERYSLRDSRIFFEYGEPGCIPLIPPVIAPYANITLLTADLLVFELGNRALRFARL